MAIKRAEPIKPQNMPKTDGTMETQHGKYPYRVRKMEKKFEYNKQGC